MKINFKKMSRQIVFHSKILFNGFIKMLCGAIFTAMIAVGTYGFTTIPTEGGYAAVSDFLVSTCMICVALGGMYLMGGTGKKGAKK